jgi:hypothetical protein
MRSPRNGGNRARENRKIEALNNFDKSTTSLRAQRLQRRFRFASATAQMVAELAFGVVSR